MKTSRRGASAVLLPNDGGVLVIGGEQTAGIDLTRTEVVDVAKNTTSSGPKLRTPRSYCTAVNLSENRILVIGGNSDGFPVYTSEILGESLDVQQVRRYLLLDCVVIGWCCHSYWRSN